MHFSHFPHTTAFLQHQLWMLQLGLANPTGHSSFSTSRNPPGLWWQKRLQCNPGWSQDPGIMASLQCKSYWWDSKKIPKGADFVLEREQKSACNIPACLFLLIPDARPGRIWLFSLSCYHSTICQQILVQTWFFFFQATFYHFFSIIMTDSESNLNWAWRRHENNEAPSSQGSTSPSFIPKARPSFRTVLKQGWRAKHASL